METIAVSYPTFAFKPLYGESNDPAELAAPGHFFSATLNDVVCYVEPLPSSLLTPKESQLVTWFRSLQTLPPHTNVLPYQGKLVACPVVNGDAAAASLTYFLVSTGAAAAMTGNGLMVGQLVSLPAYLAELRSTSGNDTLTLPENAIRSIAMDTLCALHHLHLHGLTHRRVGPSALRINTATASARLGCLASSVDGFSGAAALSLPDAEVVPDVKGLGHVVAALAAADAALPLPSPGASRDSLRGWIASLALGKPYSEDLVDFAVWCLSSGEGDSREALEGAFQHRFLGPIVLADVHRARAAGSPSPASHTSPEKLQSHLLSSPLAASGLQGSMPMPLAPASVPQDKAITSPDRASVHSAGTPLIVDALPRTATGVYVGSPFSPGSLHSRTRLVPARPSAAGVISDVRVMTCGATLPKREQYFYLEGKERRYLANYGLLFTLEVRASVTLEDFFFATVGDVRSMHVQLYWRAGDALKAQGPADASKDAQGVWTPILRRPKHLRKVMAHKPQSVGPFSLRLPFVDSLAEASRNRHSFILLTNYAHGVRLYGLPHGLLGQAVGAPLDSDGVVTVTTGVPCGADVCAAVANAGVTESPVRDPSQLAPTDSADPSDEDEVEDPRSPGKEEEVSGFVKANACACVSAALDKALASELAKAHDCPCALFGGLKYTVSA